MKIPLHVPCLLSGPKVGPKIMAINKNPPTLSRVEDKKPAGTRCTPWRLSQIMTPPDLGDRSIFFLGITADPHKAIRLETSTLCAYAYMKNRLKTQCNFYQHIRALESLFKQRSNRKVLCRYRRTFGQCPKLSVIDGSIQSLRPPALPYGLRSKLPGPHLLHHPVWRSSAS